MGKFSERMPTAAFQDLRRVDLVALPTLLVCAMALIWSASAVADQTPSDWGYKIAPGMVLVPSLGVGASYTNNFYYQPNDQDNESAAGLQITPGLTLLGNLGRYKFRVNAGLTAAKFKAVESGDDFLDHSVDGLFSWSLTALSNLEFTASHKRGHDPLGRDRTAVAAGNANQDVDEWGRYGAGVVYSYGAPSSRFGVNLGYHVVGKDYKTNRRVPSGLGTRFLDYNTQSARITGLYHYSGKTTFLASYKHTEIHIPNEFPGNALERSGSRDLYLVGVEWKATGKTSGDARIGYIDRGFDDARLDSFQKLAWQAGVTWSPKPRAQVRLETGRQPQVTYYLGSSFIDNRYYSAGFTYDWTARLSTVLGYRHTKQVFVSAGRDDKLNRYSLRGEYMLSALWDLSIGITNFHRDSDLAGADFDRTYLLVGVTYGG